MAEDANEYARLMMSLAARGCVRAGMRRQVAVLEFMKEYDEARIVHRAVLVPAVVHEPINMIDNLRKCGEREQGE